MKRSPGDFPQWGSWRQGRRPPGNLLLQGHHPNADPVSKPYLPKVLGNICKGEGTPVRWGEPRKGCQSRQNLQVAPANLANWEHIVQWFWLVEGRGGKGEEEWECPLPLEPNLQELLSGEETFLASAEAGDCFLWTLMPDDPKPFPMWHVDWLWWHTCQVDMPAWWLELWEVLGHDGHWQFMWKVQASIEVPKAWNHVKGVGNNHTPPPAHLFLGKYKFMPPPDL